MGATKEDAALVMQIVRWGSEMGFDEVVRTIMADDFDPEKASAAEPAVHKMLTFGETVATLVKHDLLDKDLVFDLWWVKGGWARVGPAALRHRERLGEPRLYENFEALAAQG